MAASESISYPSCSSSSSSLNSLNTALRDALARALDKGRASTGETRERMNHYYTCSVETVRNKVSGKSRRWKDLPGMQEAREKALEGLKGAGRVLACFVGGRDGGSPRATYQRLDNDLDEANELTYSSTSPSTSPSTSSSPSPSTSSSTSPSEPLPRLRARVAFELSRAGKWLVAGLQGYAESVNPTMAYDAQARHRLHVASSGYPTTFPYAL
ncbi:uncharacterized protein LOC125036536 [Penaeus chinensis]|uniref:uncharacterized protein LOC125036536 n=1 Tax=Penaeus chinensis TaxID=139456 RepID=UPI001FB7BF07|nr:uncharacterized protein LOC125036536 [Penaeus chinensis]